MLNVFLNVILPTFLVAGAGAGLQRWRGLTPGPLNQITLYLLGPALVVDSLLGADIAVGASVRIIAGVLLLKAGVLAVGAAVSRLMGHERSLQSAFILVTSFPNGANLALPVSLLAFGEAGLAVAIIMFVVESILGWSVGPFVAARSSFGGLGAFTQALRLPVLWAIVAALLIRAAGITLPPTLAHPVHLLGAASIPVMLLILGFQLAQGVELDRWLSLVAALAVRLIGGALIAYPITLLLGLEGIVQQTFIVVAAMPTAVFTTILAAEFDAEPRFVTSAVIASTLLSLVTLTVIITLLQSLLG